MTNRAQGSALVPNSGAMDRAMRATDTRLPATVKKAIDRESARGLVNAARAQAAGFVAEARVDAAELVTERAMLGLDRLNQVKKALKLADPIEAEEYDYLIRNFALIAGHEVRNLSRQW